MSQQRTFLARQPILDASRRVTGYELLFRSGPGSQTCDVAPDVATAGLISSALIGSNLNKVTGGQLAFVNITRNLLLEGLPKVLPPERVILEIPGSVEPDPEVMTACLRLRDEGFALAVDGFSLEHGAAFIPMARFLKVDFLATDAVERGRVVQACRAGGPALVAMKIETEETFAQAADEGFQFFQGYFFGRPELREGGPLPSNQMQLLRLLSALKNPNLSVGELEELVKTDVQLCYVVLRTVNSAAFALRTRVQSIREALVMLGRDTVRRWVSLWLLAGLGSSSHPELLAMAAARARGCELLVAGRGGDGGDGFLVGMCSMLDVLLGRPIEEVLEHLPIEGEGRAALLGEANATRHLLDTVIAYERGDWDVCLDRASAAGVDPHALAGAYAQALDFAHELTAGAASGA